MKRVKLAAAALFLATTFTMNAEVRNVIFMIGDGMGFDQVFAAATSQGGTLNMESFPVLGMHKTYSASDYITDSAAAGTAMACGEKTTNKMIGMRPDSTKMESVMSYLKGKGLATGIAVTCSFTHATPAAFYAHQPSRYMDEEIAADLANGTVDVLFSGGRKVFEKVGLDKIMSEKGYQIVHSMEEAEAVESGKLITLVANNHPKRMLEGRGNYLKDAVEKSLELLSQNEEGFFLMVEGSQIDWAGHNNDAAYNIAETCDFDQAVGAALAFAKADGNTLLVVTADHETGGMAIENGSFDKKEVEVQFTTKGHTATYVPVFSYGPGSEAFSGVMQNCSHKDRIIELMGK